jgi:hypothetical protein
LRSFVTCGLVDEDEMGMVCSINGKKRNLIMVARPGGIDIERPGRRWVDNIKMNAGGGMVW